MKTIRDEAAEIAPPATFIGLLRMRSNVFLSNALVKMSASWSRVGTHHVGIDIYVEVLLAAVEHPRLVVAHALRHARRTF